MPTRTAAIPRESASESSWQLGELRPHPGASVIPEMDVIEFAAFRADIAERGVLQPLEVTEHGVVLDGRQRLRAAAELGLERVPVCVVWVDEELEFMLRAALRRRQLSASQRAALALELAQVEQARVEARRRKRAGVRATLPEAPRPRDVAARLAGVSVRTVENAHAVREADPELFTAVKAGVLPAHAAAQIVRRRKRYSEIGPALALPSGVFDVILADPPWELGGASSDRAPENHYPTLPLEQIKQLQLPVPSDAVVFLWAVSALLPQALEVLDAWGFVYKTAFVWVKDQWGLGQWVRHRHELLLIGRRGNYPTPEPTARPDSVVEAARGKHSAKPVEVYERIERMYPQARRLELFARGRPRAGWDAWGNEVTV